MARFPEIYTYPEQTTDEQKKLSQKTFELSGTNPKAITMLISRWKDKEDPVFFDENHNATTIDSAIYSEIALHNNGSIFAVVKLDSRSNNPPSITFFSSSEFDLDNNNGHIAQLILNYEEEIRLFNTEYSEPTSEEISRADWIKRMKSHPSDMYRYPRLIRWPRGLKIH